MCVGQPAPRGSGWRSCDYRTSNVRHVPSRWAGCRSLMQESNLQLCQLRVVLYWIQVGGSSVDRARAAQRKTRYLGRRFESGPPTPPRDSPPGFPNHNLPEVAGPGGLLVSCANVTSGPRGPPHPRVVPGGRSLMPFLRLTGRSRKPQQRTRDHLPWSRTRSALRTRRVRCPPNPAASS